MGFFVSRLQEGARSCVLANLIVWLLVAALKKKKQKGVPGDEFPVKSLVAAFASDMVGIKSTALKADIEQLAVLCKAAEFNNGSTLSADFVVPLPAEVTAAMLYFKERTKGGSDIARSWQIYPGLVDMDVSCGQFIRDCQQDVNNATESWHKAWLVAN